MDPGWASRFYGVTVTKEVAAAAKEHLTDASIEDLVDAHLAINEAYFGGIDKTLSGFVVLDDQGDDYTLIDLRDSGQIWWQDHETRDVVVRYDKLADLVAVRGASESKRNAVDEKRRVKQPKSKKRVSTAALCARYQWLVWLLARPLMRDGVATQSTDYLVRNGIGRLRYVFPRREVLDETLERELPLLANDPHLAIYWLLHTMALVDDERRAQVVDAIGRTKHPLLAAFVARLGSLPLAGDVPIIPDFRARRALAITYGAFELAQDALAVTCLRALEIAPATQSLAHGLQVVTALERGTIASRGFAAARSTPAGSAESIDDAAVEAALSRIPDSTPGTELLGAALDKRRKATSSKHADMLAQQLATSDDPWWTRLEALWHTHELSYDGAALVDATRRILHHDRYHRRALQMAMRASQIANLPIDRIFADLAIADGALEPFSALIEKPEQWQSIVAGVAEVANRRGLAWRVLQRVELNKPPAGLAAWAAGEVLASKDPERVAIVGEAFAKLDAQTQTAVIEAAGKAIDRPDHPLVAVLFACLDGPEPGEHDYAAQFQLKRGKEAALRALAPWFHHAQVFDAVMKLVDKPAGGSVVDLIWGKLFSPFEKDSYVLPKLDDAQAVRVARGMIKTLRSHPNIHARNSAGHQLYRFDHRGAEAFLIDALTDYGVRYAAVKEPGGAELDHGKTENDQLEDVVANLYAAVRNMKTPGSRTALAERLFAERRAYWRMGNAIGDIWDRELHEQIMGLLAERKDPRAAGCYAFALREFVRQGPPLVELARLIIEWQGDNEIARRFLHYALVVGMIAALDGREYEVVRRTHDAASWIAEPPLEPDDYARGRGWKNPIDDEATKARLDHVLSGEAEREKQALVASLDDARAKKKPNTKISDEALGQLADTIVVERILQDAKTGEVWFKDREHRLRYFDGYGIADLAAHVVEHGGAQAELAGISELTDRALWWDAKATRFRAAMQFGDRVLLSWGVNNGAFDRYLLTLPDAAAFMKKLRAHPPKGYSESDPYYLAGKGAIVRTYYAPSVGGDRERRLLWLLDSSVSDEDFGTPERAVAEHVRREISWLAGGGVMATLEWSEHRRRREDMTLREWIKARFRDDRRDANWHLDGLAEVAAYLEQHNLAPSRFTVELGPPATDIELKALARDRKQPIPESLRTLWSTYSSARWQIGKRGMRLLSPREMLARRPIARSAGEMYLKKLPRDVAERSASLYGALDILVERQDGTPITFLADVWRDDGRVFSHAAEHPNDFWWEVSLSWMLATRLLGGLEDALADAVPALTSLKYGASAAPAKPKAGAKKRKPAAKKPKAATPTAKKKPKPKPAKRKPKKK